MAQKFYYGGQAVIEGVMMRGRKAAVTTVRRTDGSLATHIQPLSAVYTGRLRRVPLARGIIVLIEAMALGTKSLLYSASISLEEEGEKVSQKFLWAMVAAALALGVGLFFLAPLFLTKLANAYIHSSIVFNAIEGGIRMAIFIAYLWLIGLMPDIKRVFTYHGAEHKAVNAHEHGIPLEVDAIRQYGTAHMRCGTSFLFVVLIIAVVVFTFIGRPELWLMVLSRILLLPVIAALSYEVIYFGAGHARNALVRALLRPGLLLQSLTTGEPDDSQMEVALAALRQAIELDGETPQPSSPPPSIS